MRAVPIKLCSALAACALVAGMAGCASGGGSAGAGSGDNASLNYLSHEQAEAQELQTVTFGSYEQDGNESSTEAIEWYVLAEQDGKKLLISKNVLDAMPFSDVDEGVTWGDSSPRPTTDVQWADSSLRAWLNGEFLQAAFSDEERSAIVPTTITDTKNNTPATAATWDDPSVHAAEETEDSVFLLSTNEAREYFNNKTARMAYPTQHALDEGVYTGVTSGADGQIDEELSGSAVWWLRSSGYYGGYTAVVTDDGYVHGDGYRINGELHDGYDNHGENASELGGNVGVRPCIWVEDSALA